MFYDIKYNGNLIIYISKKSCRRLQAEPLYLILHHLLQIQDSFCHHNNISKAYIISDKFCPELSCGRMGKALDYKTVDRIQVPSFLHIEIQIENANHFDTILIDSIPRYVSNILMYQPNLSIYVGIRNV